ncbi:MAG TPA: response regulator, partial [Polyangiaceae bacterium]|nr:response regulator [Polyangiaceae bacterium]
PSAPPSSRPARAAPPAEPPAPTASYAKSPAPAAPYASPAPAASYASPAPAASYVESPAAALRPAPSPPSSSSPSPSLSAPAPKRLLEGVRVLIVDDEADARDLFEAILASAGAEVHASTTADQALEALIPFGPDVLVADIGMPERDGYSLMRIIRARADAFRALPAVAVTAYARAEDVTRALSVGYRKHLAKPVEPNRLVAAVLAALGRAPG